MRSPETTIQVSVQDHTCWQLVYTSGEPVDTGDCLPHFDTEQESATAAPGYAVESLGQPAPRQLDQPCWIAEVDSELMHHETADEALCAALGADPCCDFHARPNPSGGES